MQKYKKRILNWIVLLMGLFFCISCTPVIKVLPEDSMELSSIEEKKTSLYLAGVEEGRRLCKNEFLSNLSNELEKLKGLSIYEELVSGGYIVPPLIIPMYVEATVANDGKSLTTPKIEWIIVEDAKFTKEDIIKSILKRKVFVFLGLYDNYKDAVAFGKTIVDLDEKEDKLRYLKVKNSNNISVIVETNKQRAKLFESRYKGYILEH